MKNNFKNKKKLKKSTRGITLIALVVTIIVLLILAGISISMLSGENGILSRSREASTETIHTNVYEQLQLKVAEYFIEKNVGNATEQTLIEYLQSGTKPIIGDELGEEGSGKYKINVENLLGTEQKYGNGTATGSDTSAYKDVYILEKVETEETNSGSIVNTKIASTNPIKIASTNPIKIASTGKTIKYTVKYYGAQTGSSNWKLLGSIGDVEKAKNKFGYNSEEKCFIGEKSTGKVPGEEIDNYWKPETSVTIDGKDGYKFTEGHFVHVTDYNGNLWDETTNSLEYKEHADVYLCWDADYGTITSIQDLINYANNHNTTTYCDIFDASSGAWLNYWPKLTLPFSSLVRRAV